MLGLFLLVAWTSLIYLLFIRQWVMDLTDNQKRLIRTGSKSATLWERLVVNLWKIFNKRKMLKLIETLEKGYSWKYSYGLSKRRII